MTISRRALLATGALALSTAGCLDSPNSVFGDDGSPSGAAAFFPLLDWANHVGGDAIRFTTPVEVGQMGHGWEPDASIVPELAQHDAFIYLGSPEFQWAVDVADELAGSDYDVHLIDGMSAIPLDERLPFAGEHDHDADGTHTDHEYDPHVWVDPVHAQSVVDHMATELATVVPDREDALRENADAYIDELTEVDQQFEQLMADAELSVAVFAGHGAFQYLEDRYGFELRTPVGVSPNADPSIEDVVGLRDAIDEHEIDTILYDPFDAPDPDNELPQAVELLLEETDATHAEPLTSAEGLTPEWRDAGYGWVEQMTEINLPSLRRALKAG